MPHLDPVNPHPMNQMKISGADLQLFRGPVEKDTTDGVKSKDDLIREEDRSSPASEAVMEDNKSN